MMKALKVIIFSVVTIAVVFYLVVITAAPLRKVAELNRLATSDSVFMNKYTAIATYPKLLPLVKEKAHLQAQIEMAESDSIGLVINVKEKKASLMLKGVEIHSSLIKELNIDPVFKGIESPAYRKMFTNPIHNVGEYSSVIKEPIVYKKAPKDTIEAMKMLTLPVAPEPEPAYVNYDLQYGIKLILVQDKWETEADLIEEKKYTDDMKKLRIHNSIGLLKNLREPSYIPVISAVMDGKEVRAIYRALPQKANIVFIF
ncbi:MAG: hypothetical protein GXX78_07405 [Bacteroidales bacterium]|nr:hypothetical protein [Bacteroidales bacterium]